MNGILANLYRTQNLGITNNCLIQVIRANSSQTVKINYHCGKLEYPNSSFSFSENAKYNIAMVNEDQIHVAVAEEYEDEAINGGDEGLGKWGEENDRRLKVQEFKNEAELEIAQQNAKLEELEMENNNLTQELAKVEEEESRLSQLFQDTKLKNDYYENLSKKQESEKAIKNAMLQKKKNTIEFIMKKVMDNVQVKFDSKDSKKIEPIKDSLAEILFGSEFDNVNIADYKDAIIYEITSILVTSGAAEGVYKFFFLAPPPLMMDQNNSIEEKVKNLKVKNYSLWGTF